MTKQDIFKNIESLTPILKEYHSKGTATITLQQSQILKKTYQAVMPGVQVVLTCSTCIINYLNILVSYYEREYPKFVQANQPPTEPKQELVEKVTRKKGNGKRKAKE